MVQNCNSSSSDNPIIRTRAGKFNVQTREVVLYYSSCSLSKYKSSSHFRYLYFLSTVHHGFAVESFHPCKPVLGLNAYKLTNEVNYFFLNAHDATILCTFEGMSSTQIHKPAYKSHRNTVTTSLRVEKVCSKLLLNFRVCVWGLRNVKM